jgi:hypothetical protein
MVYRDQFAGQIDACLGGRKLLEFGDVGRRIGVGGQARDSRGE